MDRSVTPDPRLLLPPPGLIHPSHHHLQHLATSNSLWSPVALMKGSSTPMSLHRGSSSLADHHLLSSSHLRQSFDGRASAPPAAHQSSSTASSHLSMTSYLPPPPSHQSIHSQHHLRMMPARPSVLSSSHGSSSVATHNTRSSSPSLTQLKSGNDGNFINNNNNSSSSSNHSQVNRSDSSSTRGRDPSLPRSPFSSSCPRTIRGDASVGKGSSGSNNNSKTPVVSLSSSQYLTPLPPHIYSTIGAYPMNGHMNRTNGHQNNSSPPGSQLASFPTPSPSPLSSSPSSSSSGASSKSNFMNVDSLISKSSSSSSLAASSSTTTSSATSLSTNRGQESNRQSVEQVKQQDKQLTVISGQWSTTTSKSYPPSTSSTGSIMPSFASGIMPLSSSLSHHHHVSGLLPHHRSAFQSIPGHPGLSLFGMQSTPPAAHSSRSSSSMSKNNGINNSHANDAMKHKHHSTKEVMQQDLRGRESSHLLKRSKEEDVVSEENHYSVNKKMTPSSSSSSHFIPSSSSSRSSQGDPYVFDSRQYLSSSPSVPRNLQPSTTSSSGLPPQSAHYSYSHYGPLHIPSLYPGQGMPPHSLSIHPSLSGQTVLGLNHRQVISSSNNNNNHSNFSSSSRPEVISGSRSCDNNTSASSTNSSSRSRVPSDIMSTSSRFVTSSDSGNNNKNNGGEASTPLKRKEPNDTSSEGPVTSVSPSGSTTSNNSNSGGAKFLKKFWVQKYQDTKTTQDTSSSSLPSSTNASSSSSSLPGISSSSSISAQNGLSSPSASSSSNNNSKDIASKGKKEKVKKSKKTGKKSTSSEKEKRKECKDSDATASGSETDQADEESESVTKEKGKKPKKSSSSTKKNVPTNSSSTVTSLTSSGKKRGSPASGKEKKVKKIKSSHQEKSEEDSTTFDVKGVTNNNNNVSQDRDNNRPSFSDNNDCNTEITKALKKKGNSVKKGTALAAAKEFMSLPDSDLTEDEADDSSSLREEKETTSSTPSTGKKRGRKPKNGSSISGKSSPTVNSHSKKEVKGPSKSKKTKQEEEEDETSTSSSSTQNKTKKKSKCEPCYLDTVDKSGRPFLQDKSCSEVSPKSNKHHHHTDNSVSCSSSCLLLPKCRECRMTAYQKIKKDVGPSIFCRFYQFRKLVFDKDLKAAGFSQPKDARDEEVRIWLPPERISPQSNTGIVPSGPVEILKRVDAQFLIDFVGDHFCNLVAQEAKALSIHLGSTDSIAWKSVVAGVREMCDVCETTLFNIHWVCSECGFVVCIDCYKTRRDEEAALTKDNITTSSQSRNNNNNNKPLVNKNSNGSSNNNLNAKNNDKTETHSLPSTATDSSPASPSTAQKNHHSSSSSKDTDRFDWLHCNSKQPHLQDKLMLTQIIAKTALWDVCQRLHQVKELMGKPCSCNNAEFVKLLVSHKKHKKGVRDDNKETVDNKKGDKTVIKKEEDTTKNETSDNGILKQDFSSASTSVTTTLSSTDKHLPVSVKQEKTSLSPSSSSLTSPDVAASEEGKTDPSLTASSSSSSDAKDVTREEPGKREENNEEEEGEDVTVKNFSALRELLSKTAFNEVKKEESTSEGKSTSSSLCSSLSTASSSSLTGKKGRPGKKPPVLSTQLNGVIKNTDVDRLESTPLQYFCRRITPIFTSKNLSPRVCSLEETSKEFPNIPHDWFCDGRLLLLKDTGIDMNIKLFEQQWIRHQPVVVCKVNDWLERHLWQPSVFRNKFSEAKFDLINTETGDISRDQPLKKYWEGFENLKLRAKDKDGKNVVYKLKDWPPGEEFGDALPEQFRDLMSCIPMPEYTTHDGVRNLAGRLPRSFGLIPDLGPKMYTAYGLASDSRGTTNLHLDMSDAVNVMVYVGTLKSKEDEREHQKNVLKALEEAGVEKLQLKRAKDKKEKVGALWHIYDARDADKIRDMLNCYALEKGKKLEPHHDPIHDQAFYLDSSLRQRLKTKYGVEGYTIVQFYGDAVFIPAGAPHQVRNLSSCIKIAEDFVSPENVAHCFNLTEEFRQLSSTHDNHEDKLQIKNIIYHAVKDALASFDETA